jgi:hypothetical protein
MVTKFRQTKQKSIVCCVVDNTETYSSGWAREVSVNISDFMLHRFDKHDYDILIDADEDKLLVSASAEGYTHAVVIATGMSLGLSDRLFPAIEKICEQDFFIAGHILDRNENSYWKNGYYELHHQFYIVRLADYDELGCPFIGEQENISHTQVEPLRSIECKYNDHEVAEWIKPGTVKKQYDMKCHGWNIISVALQQDKKLIDLGDAIRTNKKYLYYEHDHVFLREMGDIYYNQFFCNNFTPAWNSDHLRDYQGITGPIEQYITVGIGVNWVRNLHQLGVTNTTRVVFTDINHNTLKFMKAMVEEWDGKDYAEFYRKHLPIMPNNLNRDINTYIDHTATEWSNFLANFTDWDSVWAKIKTLTFDYVLIDYMSTYNLDWITPGKNTVMNLSDMFTHSPYIATQSLKYRVSCENKLFNKIKQVDPAIFLIMTSRATDGFLTERQQQDGVVSTFDLTDINLLSKPGWHRQDWTSPRLLG